MYNYVVMLYSVNKAQKLGMLKINGSGNFGFILCITSGWVLNVCALRFNSPFKNNCSLKFKA